MPVPDFQSFMLPMLRLASDGCEHSLAESREWFAEHLGLTSEDVAQLLPSDRQRERMSSGVPPYLSLNQGL
ncbi:MAG TPA: winged helix-turn-helix domain-containing protein [Thermoanaerobaculia bacterium]|nr:winged helix-turn-helix domain-containing protein [Thermoanaerobaculia bacterium]